MSVMTPDQLRRGRNVPPLTEVPPQAGAQTQAVLDAMGGAPAPAAPVTPAPSAGPAANPGLFARGGQVKQLPSTAGDRAQQVAGLGASVASTAAGAANPYGAVGSYLGKKLKPKEEMPTFGGANAAYLDHLGRRFEGAGPGIAGGAATGAGYGAVAGPVGAGIGAGVGAIVGAATKNAKSAFSDFNVEDASQAIRDAYKGELGRDASDEEVMGMLTGQGWDPTGGDRWVGEKGINSVLDHIRASPEAVAFRAGGAQPGAEATVDTSVPEGAVREGSMRDVAAAMAGEGGKLEGFGGMDVNGKSKLETSTSPKYQVARVLQKYPSTPEGLRAALGEINALGIGTATIGGSKGDKLSFGGDNLDPRFNGVTTFDVIRGAGNGGEAWQWDGGGDAPAGGDDAAMLAALTGGGAASAPAGGGDTSSLPGVMQAIQALLARQGQTNQSGYTDALLRELNATA
jgi:hypothetical protein